MKRYSHLKRELVRSHTRLGQIHEAVYNHISRGVMSFRWTFDIEVRNAGLLREDVIYNL